MESGKHSAEQELKDRLADQAASWLVRLRADDVSDDDLQGFALWLSANPEHQRAMDATLDLWDDLAVTRHLPVQPVEAEPEAPATGFGRRGWLGGLAVAACAVFALVMLPQIQETQEVLRYQTGVGERQDVQLADGSVLYLNTNTALEVEIDAGDRKVRLLRGEAFFDVVSDDRPFAVDTGVAEVRVMGTAFNIYRQPEQSDITVTEGVVRVTELGNPGNRAPYSELLYANQSLSASRSGLARPQQAETPVAVAWREGKIIADGMPLAALVEEISRYHEFKILIAEPELAQRTVSGVFQLESPDTILKALEHSFEIHSMLLEDSSILLISAPR